VPRQVIEVPGLGHGTLPIPLAVKKDGLLITGGVNGVDPATGSPPESLPDEVAQVYRNLVAILDAAAFSLSDVMKITFFVADRSIRDALNPGWLELFPHPDDRPARHTLLQNLPAGYRLQAELLAVARPPDR
jgi:2-iminobutanoate/2-iminopropanoate deaminase